ncbi:pseudoazurin [Microbulbifer sp. 2205BS26-8]|uniref:pseudoazurin n=1 Tax=Microbulbifer sp. 2205BS26-8 TaxID=3064386 RepID=UPI00273E6B1E|nr:pseudoazurin [Microbulbifer sp. 2205BS26-8]MDP5208599.1 pseudoazurin [Microbulbifer sp. 2205BS26-8]
MSSISLRSAILALTFVSTSALAANHQIQMLNQSKDGMMAFEPAFLAVAPGDTITFLPTDMAHNTHSVFSPENGTSWNGSMGEKVTVTLDEEGIYLYQCDPHLALGMVGVIQVGNAGNLEGAKQHAQAMSEHIAVNKTRLEQYLDQVN